MLVPAAVLGLRLIWGLEAGHRLASEQAMLRAQGIPLMPAELPDPSRVTPEEDAVAPFLRVLSGFDLHDADYNLVSLVDKRVNIDRVEFTAQESDNLRRIWQEHERVIADLDLSGGRPKCAWPIDFDFYFGPNSTLSLGKSRMIAQFLAERAILDASGRNGADAVRQLRRIMNIARIVDEEPSVLGSLVGLANVTIAVQTFERLEPQLDWKDPKVIAQARAFLKALQGQEHVDVLRAWSPEFAFLHYWIGKAPRNSAWWLIPLIDDDEARALRKYAVNVPALRAACYPEFKSRYIAFPPGGDSQFARTVGVFSNDTEMGDNIGRMIFERGVDIRACEILVGARLYDEDRGQVPQTLADLIPLYLPSAPGDLMDGSGKAMRYRLDGDGVTVWSVGENGMDENGGLTAGGGTDRYRKQPDMVYGAAWRKHLASLPMP
jgi:hypothetical protein